MEGVFRQSPSFVVSTSFLDSYVEISDTRDAIVKLMSSSVSSLYTIRTLPSSGTLRVCVCFYLEINLALTCSRSFIRCSEVT